MRFILLFVVLTLGAAFALYPPLLEDSSGECSAVDRRVADLASVDGSGRLRVGALYGSTSSAQGGAAFAHDRYPALPPEAGCVLVYWRTVFDPDFLSAAAVPPSPAAAPAQQGAGIPAPTPARGVAPIVSRGITLNGDPISPGPLFNSPMDSVAIRVADPGGPREPERFQLVQGRHVIAACDARRTPPGSAWCKFDRALRKGVYSIAFSVGSRVVGEYPFTVLGH